MANPSIIVEFAANVDKLTAGIQQVSRSSDDLGKSTKKIDWRSMAELAAGAVALGAGVAYIKHAADETEELTKQTIALARATGLDVETASAWVSTLQLRGIEISTFITALTRLSRQMEAARTGSEKANQMFAQLGVRQADIRSGNISAVLLQVADAFQKMRNPAQKAATAQQLFGRQSQKLLPLLSSGSQGIQKQLDLAEEYGAVVGEDQVNATKKIVAAQRELELAQKGVAVSVGSALLPAQVLLWGVLLDVTRALAPLTDNMYIMVPAVVVATAAWVAYKVATIAATIASIGLNASLLITIGIVAAVVIGLALLAVGLIWAYKNVGWFHDAVQKTFTWIKRNWPYLLAILIGPIALAAVLIIKNWDKISDAAERAFRAVTDAAQIAYNWIKSNWPYLAAILIGPWAVAVVAIIKNWDKIVDGARDAVNAIKAIFSGLVTYLGGLVGQIANVATRIANAIKAPINAVISAWNSLAFRIPRIEIPSVKILGKKIGGEGFGPFTFDFPDVPRLQAGGLVTGPTLALLGEAGPELVLPLSGRGPRFDVRVFIGETELKGVVRSEIRDENNRTAQVLLSRRM